MRALRLLAMDNLVDLIGLRETLAEKEALIAILEKDLSTWRERALNEACARKADSALAFDRERELVRVLHRQLTENDVLLEQIAWLRRPWWRRLRRRATATAIA
jgi:hypothetical protein